MAVEIGRIVVGKVIRVNTLWKAMRVSVQRMVLDENTNVFVNHESTLWASDPDLKTRVGDLVLVKPLDKKPRVEITHYLKDVVFPVGGVIEPITVLMNSSSTKIKFVKITEEMFICHGITAVFGLGIILVNLFPKLTIVVPSRLRGRILRELGMLLS